ncbi:hypothetical protein [Gimesia panareensis]|uniref:hypothetical protein n=1 Tax=Gimesia panareensis TaxID=2527978 RepID=UPI00118C83E5|nr:hypothetical protein [Gimesia panareensis]QDU48376.1 hypothetical protein Pan110_06900 [Gimesia panareensis]
MERDERQLKLLSKVQIIYGILNVFVTYLFYETIFYWFDGYRKSMESTKPELQVEVELGFGLVLFLIGVAILFCIILAGQSLARYESYEFCMLVAVFECLLIPIGTVVGIWTILVLRRESVRALFKTPRPPETPADQSTA